MQDLGGKMFSKIIVLLAFMFVIPTSLCAKELDSKMEKTAQKLAAAAASQKLVGTTLSVFPFQADEKLSKKKVNVAVSEILTSSLLKQGSFKLTERVRLEEVMKEQKLGLSGAVDSKTAADIGKLLGAKLLVLGNVIQVGNFYQITSKLVNSESGEIITSEIVEVPVKTFDEDAERYLVLVPDRQTIAIQFLLPERIASINSGAAQTFAPAFGGSPITSDVNSNSDKLSPMGFGLRYFPASWLVLDGAYFLSQKVSATVNFTQTGVAKSWGQMEFGIGIVRLGAAYTGTLSKRMRFYTGLMMLFPSVDFGSEDYSFSLAGGGIRVFNYKSGKKSYPPVPMARAGLEWKPQERFGFSLFGNFSSGKKEIISRVALNNSSGGGYIPLGEADVLKIKFPAASLEGNFSFYF